MTLKHGHGSPRNSDFKYKQNKGKAYRVACSCSTPALAYAGNVSPCTYHITYRKHRVQIFRGKLPRYGESDDYTEVQNGFRTNDFIGDFGRSEDKLDMNFPFELNNTTLKYKGNHWSKLSSDRPSMVTDLDVPGVGTYDLLQKPPKPFDVHMNNVRFCKKAMAKSLRTLDEKIIKLNILNEPGPGAYDVGEKYDRYKPIYESGTFPKAERWKPIFATDFSPLINLRQDSKLCSPQLCWPPFNSSSPRKTFSIDSDGPDMYYVWNHTILYKLARELLYPRVVAPFNSCSGRVSAFVGNMDVPGPGTYCVDRFPFKPRTKVYGQKDPNCFDRAYDKKKEKTESERMYELDSSFKKVRNRKDFHRGEVWIRTKTDRLGWMVNKNSPDVLYDVYDERRLCSNRCINSAGGQSAAKIPKSFRELSVSDYYVNRLYKRMKAILSDAHCGELSPSPWCANSDQTTSNAKN